MMLPIGGPDLLPVPIFLPLVAAILSLAVGPRAGSWIAAIGTTANLAATVLLLRGTLASGPLVYPIGGWSAPVGIVLVTDAFSALLVSLSALLAAASAVHTLTTGGVPGRHYHPLFLLMTAALGGVFLTGDLFNLYVFMEMVILSSFALVAMAHKPVSAEVTFKYAVLSALGSLFLLLSVALIYASVGTLALAEIGARVRQGDVSPFWESVAALMLAAFLLKAAIFPFHFWQPDAHSTAPAAVSAMLSGVLVTIGIYGIARMATLLFPGAEILVVVLPLGAVSALFGGVAAVTTHDLKRLLAYSTIANMGFILIALGLGGEAGFLAALIGLVNHAIVKGGLFLIGGHVAERLGEQELATLSGVARVAPTHALLFGIGALSLAGVPPFNGFVSKLALVQAVLVARDVALLGLVAVASGLGLIYSVRAFVGAFWGETPPWVRERWAEHDERRSVLLAPALLGASYLLLGLWPAPLVALTAAAATDLADPRRYIVAVLGGGP